MTTLMDAPQSEDWFNPATLSPEQNEELCQALEAFFAPPEAEEKREFPHELSALLLGVIGQDRLAFSLNAGDGSALTAFSPAYCFGVEPKDGLSRKRKGRYQNISGQLPRVSHLIEPLGSTIGDTIVVLRDGDNIEDALDFLNANIDSDTFMVYLSKNDDGTKHFETLKTKGLFAAITLADLQLAIYFCADPDRIKKTEDEYRPEIVTRAATPDTLDLLGPWVNEQKINHCVKRFYRYANYNNAKTWGEIWKAVHREYGRRFLRETRVYDLELVGRNGINYDPSDWAKLAVAAQTSFGDLKARIHNKDIHWFAQNSGYWREILICADQGILLVEPALIEAVAPIIEDAERINTPLRPLKLQERLGYLHEVSKIKCIKDDEERGLRAGRYYSVYPVPHPYYKPFTKTEPVKGVLQVQRKRRLYTRQDIKIDSRLTFADDNPDDIKFLFDHFAIPDRPDLRTRYPELIAKADERIQAIEDEYLAPRGLKFKPYQKKDIAALSVHNRGILAWQQGLGKTPGGVAFAIQAGLTKAMADQKKSGRSLPVLIVAPQDLIPQWMSEAQKFYGIDLQWIGRHKGNAQKLGGSREVEDGNGGASITGGAIRNLIEAREIDRQIKAGGTGWYITHFEALTMGGARNLRKIEEPYVIRIEKEDKWIRPGWRTNPDTKQREYFDGGYETVEREITTANECPECGHALHFTGQLTCNRRVRKHPNDIKARRCGWTRLTYKLPSIGQILSTTFRNGIIVVDEGTQIASARNSNEKNSSQKTKAVCGMRAANRLVMSGTPVKNFIAQAFWLLWWGIGNKSERFNYAYAGGKSEFAKDFTVLEWTYNEETGNWANVQEVGEVTNHTRLWAQLASVLLRRRKEETGELIVKKKDHVIHTPLGYYQREQMDYWLRHFPDLFAEKYPDDPKVKRGTHRNMAAILGLDHKLNYAAVLPKTDPDHAWTNVPVSNYTPAAFKALETIMALVKQGRPVLVGTDIKRVTPWLAARLTEKGITARTMLKANGSGDTLDPKDRAKIVEEFQNGAMAVLVSTQKAIRLGHNLDKGQAVVLLGLDWDYETYAQFTERVHRLTSERPIDVYVIIPGEENLTLVGRKWDRIQDKAKGAGMAIDGLIPEQNEDPPDIAAILKEMMEKGIPATGQEIQESSIEAAWEKIPHIDQFEIPEGFADNQATEWIIDWEKANACLNQHLAVKQAWLDEEAEIAEANEQALGLFLQEVVDKQLCEALEAFFAGATAPIEEVADATNSLDSPLNPETAVTTAAGATEAGTHGPEGPAEAPTAEDSEGATGTEVQPPTAVEDGQLTLGVTEPGGSSDSERKSEDDHVHPAPVLDPMAQLKQAKELNDLGVLTDDEFAKVKAEMLGLLGVTA